MSAVLFASFDTQEALIAAAAAAREERFRLIDTFTPYPVDVEGAEPANGPGERALAWVIAVAGLTIGALVYAFEWFTAAVAYPFNAGARPLNSWPVFLLAPFEIGVLAAAIGGLVALLVLCGLPRLNSPAFDSEAVERAGRDRFVLALEAPGDQDRRKALTALLDQAMSIEEGELEPRILLLPALFMLGACDLSMRKQPRYDAQSQAPLWSDGSASRPIPAGVVAVDDPARTAAELQPATVDAAMLQRGQDRFDIFCAPCHGKRGDGNGLVVQRGFPPPPDYELPRLRAAPAQHIYEVISNGYGVMYPYGDRISAADRWAIVAYVRALQTARSPAAPPAVRPAK